MTSAFSQPSEHPLNSNWLLITTLALALLTSSIAFPQSPGTARREAPIGSSNLEIWIESRTLEGNKSVDTVEVKVDSRGTEIAAFDFTFAYDRAAFEILDALPGTFPDSCDWEYFTVRHSPACSGPCPSGLIKIVALSEYADSRGQACHLPEEGASLIKFVIRPRTPESMDFLDLSLRFFWIDCGDNSVASVSGNELFLAAETLEPDSIPLPVYGDQGFPNYTGPPSDCFRGRAENAPFAKLNLRNGLLRYTPSESAPVAPSDSSSDAPVDSSR